MLWLIFAILTIAVVVALLYPVLRAEEKAPQTRIAYDMVVYRDQLAELDREIEDGLLAEAQATAARAEIHRRMLAAEDAELMKAPRLLAADSRRAQLFAVLLIALIVPVGAAAFYGMLGSPKLPGMPYAWRVAHDPGLVAAATAEDLARDLKSKPSVAGYRRLAGMYFTARDFERAAAADREALGLGAHDASVWSEYGEALAMSAGGMIIPEAMLAFTNALDRDPHDERARFYVGLAEAQIGNARLAVGIWRDLLASAPPDASWRGLVETNIKSAAQGGGFDPQSVPPKPPSLDALKSAVSGMMGAMQSRGAGQPATPPAAAPPAGAGGTPVLDPNDPQMAMIRTMVGRLAARMEQNPGDADGWRRLAHAYVVLGEKDKARAAIAHAVKLKPNDPDVQATLGETK